jgi:hypothetical protein
MAKEPDRPARKGSLFVWATEAWLWMRQIRPLPGPGVLTRVTPNGTIISVAPRGGRAGGDRRFKLSFNRGAQKIRVSPGMVVGGGTFVAVGAPGGGILEPDEPTINGVPLSQSDGISVEGFDPDQEYGVFIIGGDGTARIEASQREDLELEEEEIAFLIGWLTFEAADGGLKLKGKIDQRWLSDVNLQTSGIVSESVDTIASSASNVDVVDSTPSNSSDDSDLPPPDLCIVKATLVRGPQGPTCAYYRKDPFTGKVVETFTYTLLTRIVGNPSCVCPNWHARVKIEGAKPAGSTQGRRVDGDWVIVPVGCGDDFSYLTFEFDPAVPESVHLVTIELKSNPEVDPGPLYPDWEPSKCCGQAFQTLRTVKLPPRCGDTTMVPP